MIPRSNRRGLTLLELLVVVFILSILLAVSIPIFRVPAEEKAIREAARSVSAALGMARTRALETGRPYGVRFERLGGTSQGSGRLSFVTVPPPYAGDYDSSRLRIGTITPYNNPDNDGELRAIWTVRAGVFPAESDELVPAIEDQWYSANQNFPILRKGDILKLNHQGHEYRMIDIQRSGDKWTLEVGCKTITLWPYVYGDVDLSDDRKGGPEYSYQFFRQPVPTSSSPVLLPSGAVVDIVGSGVSGKGLFRRPNDTLVTVAFTPSGLVDRVWHPDKPQGEKLFDSVFFLIGKPGHYLSDNFNDLDCLWISINYQTGLISTANMAVLYDENNKPRKVNVNSPNDIQAAREYARSGESIRG
jgi:prepilin-type N-terminal cleavage/methylation domain-containing protein